MANHGSYLVKLASRQRTRKVDLATSTNVEFVDRVSTTVLKGHRVKVTWIDPDLLPGVAPRSIYGVAVAAFSGEDLVMVELGRGIEIPAGTVEDTDTNLEATARREAWEEACITLEELHLVQLMRVEWLDRTAPLVYVPVYAAEVNRLAPFERRHETYSRMLVSCEEYVDVFGFGTTRDRQQLISDAKKALYGRISSHAFQR